MFLLDYLEIFTYFAGLFQGVLITYLVFAPETKFKANLIDVLVLKFIWGRFFKPEPEEDPYEALLPKSQVKRKW